MFIKFTKLNFTRFLLGIMECQAEQEAGNSNAFDIFPEKLSAGMSKRKIVDILHQNWQEYATYHNYGQLIEYLFASSFIRVLKIRLLPILNFFYPVQCLIFFVYLNGFRELREHDSIQLETCKERPYDEDGFTNDSLFAPFVVVFILSHDFHIEAEKDQVQKIGGCNTIEKDDRALPLVVFDGQI